MHTRIVAEPRRRAASSPARRRRLVELVFLLVVGAAAACVDPSAAVRRETSSAWAEPELTRLGRESGAALAAHPELSGVHVLGNGLDAFAARALLCAVAEKALDVQYYILRDDATGRFLLGQLLAAADRGVRVRLLLDDVGTRGLDATLAALDAHPSIEVRLFNPYARGSPSGLVRALDTIRRPRRLNHRMHNKLLAADGSAAIVGGRNLADEYFDASDDVNFADLDLLAIGPVLGDLGACFDQYWNSPFVVPVAAWQAMRGTESDLKRLAEQLAAHAAAQFSSPYAQRLRSADIVEELLRGELSLVWGDAHAVADAPEKVVATGDAVEPTLLIGRIRGLIPDVVRELTIVSPYFVPGRAGVDYFRALRERGVRVRILTNSFAASDVPAVHAGYAKYRVDLLRAGVELFELRPTSASIQRAHAEGELGSSGASLHAKTFCFDGRTVFVGSLNLDPRSVELNTELGLLIDSEELAANVLERFERGTRPDVCWRVSLAGEGDAGQLVWEGEEDGAAVRLTSEPKLGFWDRTWLGLLRVLPIEDQL